MLFIIKELKQVVLVYSFGTIILALLLMMTNWIGLLAGKLVREAKLTKDSPKSHYDNKN